MPGSLWRWLTDRDGQRQRIPLRAPPSLAEQRAGLLQNAASDTSSLHLLDSEESKYVKRRMDNPMWSLDRGTGYYQRERADKKKASLMGTGKEAGKSQISYVGVRWSKVVKHVWKKDFFTTAIHAKFYFIVPSMFFVYSSTFMLWATIYYITWIWDNTCFIGFDSFQSAFLFSIETQQTIGYGTHAIGDCWLPAWMVAVHCLFALLMDSIFIGIIFAKVSHPKSRSRTILISESCCIARRNGVLKLMFRVADIRKRTAIHPRITAALYTWSQRRTAEGEFIPIMTQALPLHYKDPLLLVPVVIEHTIDERSPLYGHTAQTLEALSAEIVVVFEGTNELGDQFTARQSYLPGEIHWGHVFVNILEKAPIGTVQHVVNLARFHDVEPQEGLALLPPPRLSRWVVSGGSKKVPFSRLDENTLTASDELCVCPRDGGMLLVARLGDTYPSQMVNVQVRMFVYRYGQRFSTEGEQLPYEVKELPLVQPQCMLRYPMQVAHAIDESSPIASWATSEGMLQDADAEVVLTATAIVYCTSRVAMRSKVYPVLGGIKWGWAFVPCVTPPAASRDGRTQVHWEHFHSMQPIHPQAQSRSKAASRHPSFRDRDDTITSGGDHYSTHTSYTDNTYNSIGRGQHAASAAAGVSGGSGDSVGRAGPSSAARGAEAGAAGFSGRAQRPSGLPPLQPKQRPQLQHQHEGEERQRHVNILDVGEDGSIGSGVRHEAGRQPAGDHAWQEASLGHMHSPLGDHLSHADDDTLHAKVSAWQDDHTLTLAPAAREGWAKKRSLANIFPLLQDLPDPSSPVHVGAGSSSSAAGQGEAAWRGQEGADEEEGGAGSSAMER